ncbi:MAG TPA: hypothetical protein VMV90_02950 [Rectinemataceae bacterium]|nr:hypothetical protein [Rectinemataceae bacterium]
MVTVCRKKRGISYTQKWFAREAGRGGFARILAYYQYLGERPPGLFLRKPFSTLLVDIGRQPELVLADMHKVNRVQIQKAEREGLSWRNDVRVEEFVERYNAFAAEKSIAPISAERVASFKDSAFLSLVELDGVVLAQHFHIVDAAESRARFVYGSSGRFSEGSDPALIGRANRWCHWRDMLHFRESGIATYDFGGYAPDTEDPVLRGINEFKSRFGGAIVREDHWLSPLYALAGRLGLQ